MRLLLLTGTLLIFLAFYKGDGGYHDLVNYLDDAEGLWLHGDMRRLEGIDEEEKPDGTTIERPIYGYSQYSLGLAFVSGPFVLLGKTIDLLSGEKSVDDSGRTRLSPRARKIAVLIIPLFAALTCLLVFEIGKLLGASTRASLWAAMMLAVASSLLSFARLFYTEVAVIFFAVLSLWAFLRADASSGRSAVLWSLLAGLGAAGAAGCHYAESVLIAPLGLAMAYSVFKKDQPSFGAKAIQLFALAAPPILAGIAILAVNYARRGSALNTGYGSDVDALDAAHIFRNMRFLLFEHLLDPLGKSGGRQWLLEKPGLFVRNLWVLPAMLCLAFAPEKNSRLFRLSLLIGVILQVLFWMSYSMLAFSPVRYLQPATGVFSIALVFLGAKIEKLWPRFGLISAGIVFIAWNAMFFLMNDDHNAPFAFGEPPQSPLLIYSWYMEPFKNGLTDGYGTPIGAMQWAIFGLFLSGGAACWILCWRKAEPLRNVR